MKKWFGLAVIAALQFAPALSPASAQNFPSRPIRIVVPFDAGGAMDVVIRIIAKKIADDGGAQIVIENKTGAGGAIGVVAVKDATPDGYTLLEASSSTHVLNPHMTANIPYDPVKDFQPITMLVKVPTFLTVPASLPVKSVKELIEYGRNKPGGLSYGSAGVGSAPHITGALFAKATGIPMTHVPYRGLAGSTADLIAGRIDFVFGSLPSVQGQVRDGKLKLLAVAGKQRVARYPDLPSMADAGFAGVDVDLWFGVLAPLGTDPAIVRQLHAMFVKATNAPDLAQRWTDQGLEIATNTPDAFRQAIAADNTRLGPFVKALAPPKQ